MKNKYTFDYLFNADRVDMMRTVTTIGDVEFMALGEDMVEEDTQEKLSIMREGEIEDALYEECTMSPECGCDDCEKENVWMDR
jgi:hypothetical protein